MGRTQRKLPAGHSFHITLRCNSRQFLIAKGLRRDVLLAVLAKAKQKVPHRLYAVCLMANHLHLLLRPDDASQLPKLMHWNGLRGHSTPTSHLGDKADFTPSPLKGSGSNRGCLTGETYDVVRSYGICSYRAGFSHPPYAPSKPLQPRRENGAERNRTAVRNTGVDHLVRSRTDLIILASRPTDVAS